MNTDVSEREYDSTKDIEESEWIVFDEKKNKIVSNVKEVATNFYEFTDVRVDQIGPYRIAFRTKDNQNNRMTYEELYKIVIPLKEFIKLPIYIGGSHSPLSRKLPNPGSDIDIYIITDNYSYEQAKELQEKINEYIKEKPEYDKCSIGQVQKEWLEFPYFYEAVSFEEKEWWELEEEELKKRLSERRKIAIEKIENKTVEEIIEDIEKIYGIKVRREDIINITTTPRWKSINDCSFRRGNTIKYENKIMDIMNKLDQWLIFENEETTLDDAIKNSSFEIPNRLKCDRLPIYIKLSDNNGKYWLFNSIINGVAEAATLGAKKIDWIINSEEKEEEIVLQSQLKNIVSCLSEHFGIEIDNHFINLDEYFADDKYADKIEELKKSNYKYRKICNLDLEVKLYAFSRLNKCNELFIINPEKKVGKMLKHSGLKVMVPFINKFLEDFQKCPEYAKKAPSGYCLSGARNLMLGKSKTYKCECEKEEDYISKQLDELWKEFNKSVKFKKGKIENKKIFDEFSIVDRTKEDNKDKAIILFGSPTIDLKNLLLLKTSELYSNKDTLLIVEDIMAPCLYKKGIYESEKVKKIYKSLEKEGVRVQFNSDDEEFPKLLDKWLKKLQVKDLVKLSPLTVNSNIYRFHVYDALHLAIMGATYEKAKDKMILVHSYNESALHIFNKKDKNNLGYISCHQIPGEVKQKKLRIQDEEDLIKNRDLIQNIMGNVKVNYIGKDNQIIPGYSLTGKKIKIEKEEYEK